MSIQTIALLALSGCALLSAFVFWMGRTLGAQKRRPLIRFVVVVLAFAVPAVAALGARPFASKFGPVVTWESLIVAAALDVAFLGGYVAGGMRGASGSSIVGIATAAAVVLDLAVAGVLNSRIARAAQQLGIGVAVKYEPQKNKDCPSNLKELYNALSMYVEDWDALPPADGWMKNDDLTSKVRENEWLHCPAVSNRHDRKYGYAYNDRVAGRKLNGLPLKAMPEASSTPLLYDSSNLEAGAHDAMQSLPKPGRHQGRNNILFCDGHVEAVAP
ncbi:MAG TPA: H-X9-DG-CTERM domain-containing protein [Chthonomonadales bacterium]|nr:H-X9-DG-CTERM domain-containing protein [Chthonomonadales bacterium]